jgi:putative acetyltransferase
VLVGWAVVLRRRTAGAEPIAPEGQKEADMISIRQEEPGDREAVRLVNELAFGGQDEAEIVDALRETGDVILSLVALHADSVVGHIMFSPVRIEEGGCVVEGTGLGPMAVLPEYQRQGIGSALVESGLRILRDRACAFVVVLGHSDYYPRFGFEPASRRGIKSQWEGIPDDVFMVYVFDEYRMKDVHGVVRYGDEFLKGSGSGPTS